MRTIEERIHSHMVEWAPKIAFVAAFGITSIAIAGFVRGYRKLSNTVKMLESRGYEDPTQD